MSIFLANKVVDLEATVETLKRQVSDLVGVSSSLHARVHQLEEANAVPAQSEGEESERIAIKAGRSRHAR